MPKAGRGAILLSLMLLAGCAGVGGESEEDKLQAASVMRAFASLCGRLDTTEIAQRGESLGFLPIDPSRLPSRVVKNFPTHGGVQLMARPSPGPGQVGAILAWNTRNPSCELAVARVSTAALEREFDGMVTELSGAPGYDIQRGNIAGTPPIDAVGMRLRRAALLVPRTPPGASGRAVLLRVVAAPVPDGQVQAILAVHIARPQAGDATPPPAPGR